MEEDQKEEVEIDVDAEEKVKAKEEEEEEVTKKIKEEWVKPEMGVRSQGERLK